MNILEISHLEGLNRMFSIDQIRDTEGASFENVYPAEAGVLTKRKGTRGYPNRDLVAYTGKAWIADGLRFYGHPAKPIVLFVSGDVIDDKVLRITHTTPFLPILDRDLIIDEILGGSPLGRNHWYYSWVVYGNILGFTNGDAPIQFTDGDRKWDLVGTNIPKRVYLMKVYRDRLWAVSKDYPDRVFFSAVLDFTSWGINDFITISSPKGEAITALGIATIGVDVTGIASQLVIFTENTTFLVSGAPPNLTLNQLSGRIGCIAHRSVVSTNVGLIFLDKDCTVYLLRHEGDPIPIGITVQPLIRDIVNKEKLYLATACFNEGFYKLSFASKYSDTNDVELWCDLRRAPHTVSWWGVHRGKGRFINCYICCDGRDDFEELLAGRGDRPMLIRIDEEKRMDFDEPIKATIQTKTFKPQLTEIKWRLYSFDFKFTEPTHVDLEFTFDQRKKFKTSLYLSQPFEKYDEEASVWDFGTWDIAGFDGIEEEGISKIWWEDVFKVFKGYFPPGTLGRNMNLVISHDEPKNIKISSMFFGYEVTRRI